MASVAGGYTRSRLARDAQVEAEDSEVITLADLLAVLPGATASITASLNRAVFDAVAALEDRVNSVELTATPIRQLHKWLTELDERFRADQAERADQAAEFLARVGPETTANLLARVDMNEVLSEVDMDALVERVAVEKVLERLDVNSLVSEVITELDAANLLREGTGVIASNTVDSIRTLPGAASRMAGRVVRRPGT